ncbi:MFS transporter [Millisia brevis]|uniref:MFS transporter n=1 Tax=Millisia brevis TaxID=264148 RepID=UPI0008369B08|nr:MFS transporter [Millisia brevis]
MTHDDPGPNSSGFETVADAPSLFDLRHRWITLAAIVLIFLVAFENLAVTTAMPVISTALDGERLYALAFAAPLATGVIGMVVCGLWSDRSGPRIALWTSIALFVSGLVICGLAPTMDVLVAGRLIQGFGGGALNVALYVLVARVYPDRLHPAIFGGFAAAWVLPALIGPAIAGFVAERIGWPWVFLGVAALVIPIMAVLIPVLRPLDLDSPPAGRLRTSIRPVPFAILAAAAILVLSIVAEHPGIGIVAAAVAAMVALLATRPLLPPGTLRGRPGLPGVVLVRGLAGSAVMVADVYIPFLLTDRYGFSAVLAGLTLTMSGVAWGLASLAQGYWSERISHRHAILGGALTVFAGTALVVVTAWWHLPPVLVTVSWTIAGGGIGLMYPRISTSALALSTPTTKGFNSSALSVADSLGTALILAIAGAVFGLITYRTGSFTAVFTITAVLALGAVLVAARATAGRALQPVEPNPGPG